MTTDSKGRRFYRREEIWRETGLSRATVDRLIVAKKFVKVKVGRNTLITAESYQRWVESLKPEAA